MTTYPDQSDRTSCFDSPPFRSRQGSPSNLAFRARTEASKALLLGDLLAGSQQSDICVTRQSHHLCSLARSEETAVRSFPTLAFRVDNVLPSRADPINRNLTVNPLQAFGSTAGTRYTLRRHGIA